MFKCAHDKDIHELDYFHLEEKLPVGTQVQVV